jgi:hypothetical protein
MLRAALLLETVPQVVVTLHR